MVFIGIVFAVLVVGLIVYLRLILHDIKGLRKQLAYIEEEESSIFLTTSSHNRQVNELNKQLNIFIKKQQREKGKYVQLDKEFKQAITNVSHDIRTPLTSINGYLQMIELSVEEQERKKYFQIVHSRLAYLKQLLDELFFYTKITNMDYDLELEQVALYPMVCNALLEFYDEFEKAQILPEVSFAQQDIKLIGNLDAWKRIIHNLLMNTIRHGKHSLSILETVEDNHVQLRFENEISTFDEFDVTAMFDRFYKGDRSRKDQSTGLGLAIVKELVQQMGGSISAQVDKKILSIIITVPWKDYIET